MKKWLCFVSVTTAVEVERWLLVQTHDKIIIWQKWQNCVLFFLGPCFFKHHDLLKLNTPNTLEQWNGMSKATTMASRQMPMKRKSPCAPCDRFLICLRPQNVPKQRPQDFGEAPNGFGYEENRISMGESWGNFRFLPNAPKPSWRADFSHQ